MGLGTRRPVAIEFRAGAVILTVANGRDAVSYRMITCSRSRPCCWSRILQLRIVSLAGLISVLEHGEGQRLGQNEQCRSRNLMSRQRPLGYNLSASPKFAVLRVGSALHGRCHSQAVLCTLSMAGSTFEWSDLQ